MNSIYHLDIQEFLIYQNQLEQLCFGDQSSQKLTKVFEKLSGSDQFKEKYEQLRSEISHQENLMKRASESLKEHRHEKIKIKGLSEFQKQIDECIKEQKEIESVLVGLSLLQATTHCKDIQTEQQEISESIQKCSSDRISSLNELKQLEAQLRKIENEYSDKHRHINRLREQIMTFKNDSIHKQKTIDNTKIQIEQKRLILSRLEQENKVSI